MNIPFARFFCLTILALSQMALAQEREAERAWLIGVGASAQIPSGAWAERFSSNMTIGTEQGFKFAKGTIISAEGYFGFGSQIKDRNQLLGPGITSNGNILSDVGSNATVSLYQRSTYFNINLEQVLPFWQATPNSGPIVGVGAGYLWHWVRVDNPGNNVPQLHDEYRRGIDELSHGLMSRQSVGYLFMSNNRRVNFKVSLEYAQGFTANRRGYHYALGPQRTDVRLSTYWGLKINWYIPLYRGGKTEEYYYN